MKFYKTLLITIGLLWQRKRVSYLALKQEFGLDDAGLEALRIELIRVEQVALDEDGEFLVWAGACKATTSASFASSLSSIKSLAPTYPPVEQAAPVPVNALTDAAASVPVTSATPEAGVSEAERRPLTVMFCDLADSTALSTKLDPEDLQDVIRTYQETCSKLIQEYEGYVAKYMGDGILVYFGYPKSRERNAERAVRSGLAIVEAIVSLNRTWGLSRSGTETLHKEIQATC